MVVLFVSFNSFSFLPPNSQTLILRLFLEYRVLLDSAGVRVAHMDTLQEDFPRGHIRSPHSCRCSQCRILPPRTGKCPGSSPWSVLSLLGGMSLPSGMVFSETVTFCFSSSSSSYPSPCRSPPPPTLPTLPSCSSSHSFIFHPWP